MRQNEWISGHWFSQSRSRFVQDDEVWIAQKSARDGDSGLLSAADEGAGCADARVEARRQAVGELRDASALRGIDDLVVGRERVVVGEAELDVVGDRAVEEARFLLDVGDATSQFALVDVFDVDAVEFDGAVLNLVLA